MNSIQPQSNIEAYQQALKELQELSNQTTLKIKEQINLFRSIQAANPDSKEIISGISNLMGRALDSDRKIEKLAQELLQSKLQINKISDQSIKETQALEEKEKEVQRLQNENEKIAQEYQEKLQRKIGKRETEIRRLSSDLDVVSKMFLWERTTVEVQEEKIERIKAKRTIKVTMAKIAEEKAYECAAEAFGELVESKAEFLSSQEELAKAKEKHQEREEALSKKIEDLMRNQEIMVKSHLERESSLSKKLEELIKSHAEDEELSLQLLREKDDRLAWVERENEKLKEKLSEAKSRKAKKVQSLKRKHAELLEGKNQEINKLKAKNERAQAKRQKLIEDCDQKSETIETQKESLEKQGEELEKIQENHTCLKLLSGKIAQDYIKAYKELSTLRKEARKIALQQAREKKRDVSSSSEEDENSSMSDLDSYGDNATGNESSSNENNDASEGNRFDQGPQILILNEGDHDETDYLLMN